VQARDAPDVAPLLQALAATTCIEDRLKNLQEWISRNKPVAGAKGPFELCFARLQKIEDAHTYLTENQDISSSVQEELFRYIPIATTAAIDAYFKSVMARLVDSGEPYLYRACSISGRKLSLENVAHLQNKKFTLGEMLAFEQSFGSVPAIDGVFSTLLGTKFLKLVETVELDSPPFSAPSELEEEALRMGQDFFGALQSIFEIRHRYCHEFAVDDQLDKVKELLSLVALPSFILRVDVILFVAERKADEFAEYVSGR